MEPKFDPKLNFYAIHAHFRPPSEEEKVGKLGDKTVTQHAEDVGIRPSDAVGTEPILQSHKFTHPQIDKTMEKFANDLLEEFSPVRPEFSGYARLKDMHPKEEKEYVDFVEKALSLPDQINEEIQPEIPKDKEKEFKEKEFVNNLVDALGSSLDRNELLIKLNNLIHNQKFSEEFLSKLFLQLKEHKKEIAILREARGRFESSYKEALTSAQGLYGDLQSAFYGKERITIDPQTKFISVSLAQFRLAMHLFNQEFGWMTKYACSQDDKKLTTHLFATLLCGKKAPSLEELPNNFCCFAIRELTNVTGYTQQVKLEEGKSAVFNLLNYIEDPSPQGAASAFIQDNITRIGNDIFVAGKRFEPGFLNNRDLEKPFFLESVRDYFIDDLIKNPGKVDSMKKSSLLQVARAQYGSDFLTAIFAKYLESNSAISESQKNTLLMIKKILSCAKLTPVILEKIKAQPTLNPDEIEALLALKTLEMFIVINGITPGNSVRAIVDVLNENVKEKFYVITPEVAHCFYTLDPSCDRIECQGTIQLRLPYINDQSDVIIRAFSSAEKLIFAQLNFRYTIPSLEETKLPERTFSDLVFSPFASVSLIDLLAEQLGQKFVGDRTADEIRERCEATIKALKDIEKTFKDDTCMTTFSKFHSAFKEIKAFERLLFKGVIEKKKIEGLQKLHKDLQDEVKKAWEKVLAHYTTPSEEAKNWLKTIQKEFPGL